MIRVFSRGIRRIPHLEVLLGCRLADSRAQNVDAVAGWGYRPSALRAMRYAKRHGLPYVALEDGFLRSVGAGPDEPPLSLVCDDLGIYYDASRASRLETLIKRPVSAAEAARAHELVARWQSERVSKYNHLREHAKPLPERFVLVADQTYGDASIRFGNAGPKHFAHMLEAALSEHPNCTVILKIHPDVFAGRKRGHFDAATLAAMPRVQVLADDVHPVGLLERCQAVYTVTSQLGFEALIWQKQVRTFGMPFYAGWGLTDDDQKPPSRRCAAALEQVVHAALIEYPRYVHPESGQRCEPEALIDYLGLQRRMRSRFPRELFAVRFSPYKRPLVRQFCWGSNVRFVKRGSDVPAGATIVRWGRAGESDAPNQPGNVLRIEDGFLRSVGLGADLIRPLSWVIDTRGIYYDAAQTSDLEHLLQNAEFPAPLIERARLLRERILAANLTKYNDSQARWTRTGEAQRAAGRILLVPGQVESDASLAFGAPNVRTNADLLRTVRETHPDAWIIYKPHPDVVAGLRSAGVGEAGVLAWCNERVVDVNMGQLLCEVDEVHTLTSLAGFEALLRGKTVTCYGQPFYAGWGLTSDVCPVTRRTRRLALDELVAGTLIRYPTYVSRATGRFTTPERALDELMQWREQQHGQSLWRRTLRWLLRGYEQLRT